MCGCDFRWLASPLGMPCKAMLITAQPLIVWDFEGLTHDLPVDLSVLRYGMQRSGRRM